MQYEKTVEAIKAEISLSLGFGDNPPVSISDKGAATVLGVKTSTLATWRSSGRYGLPFIKVGGAVRYRIADLAAFLAGSISSKTA